MPINLKHLDPDSLKNIAARVSPQDRGVLACVDKTQRSTAQSNDVWHEDLAHIAAPGQAEGHLAKVWHSLLNPTPRAQRADMRRFIAHSRAGQVPEMRRAWTQATAGQPPAAVAALEGPGSLLQAAGTRLRLAKLMAAIPGHVAQGRDADLIKAVEEARAHSTTLNQPFAPPAGLRAALAHAVPRLIAQAHSSAAAGNLYDAPYHTSLAKRGCLQAHALFGDQHAFDADAVKAQCFASRAAQGHAGMYDEWDE